MKIAILGAGFVGESLARALVSKGHEVMLSSRNPRNVKIQNLIADIGDKAHAGSLEDTLAFSEVVALALQWDIALEVIEQTGDWSQKIVLDMTQGDLIELQQRTGARVVKIFNSIGAEHYQNPRFHNHAATMFYCGNNNDAKQIAAYLASDLGFIAHDAGSADMWQHLVHLAQFWVALMENGMGRDFAFRLIRK